MSPVLDAWLEMSVRAPARLPPLPGVLVAARAAMVAAVTRGEYQCGDRPARDLGPRAFWFRGCPVGQWVTEREIFRGDSDQIIALEIFDPHFRETLYWFVQSADRRRYEAECLRQSGKLSFIERDAVEVPIAQARRAAGHDVCQQLAVADGRIDIYDATANEIIECKAKGSTSDLVAAASQLRRYQAHFPTARLVIAVPWIEPEALWLADLLRPNVRIIEVDKGGAL